MAKISKVEISLDDNVPEYMDGVIRVGSIEYDFNYDEGDEEEEFEVPDLVDNTEFHSEKEMIEYVAKKLSISSDIIDIV